MGPLRAHRVFFAPSYQRTGCRVPCCACSKNVVSLPKSRRVLRSSEFREIYQSGVRMTSRYFAAFCLQAHGEVTLSRFGFTTPRAVGKAVIRNRLKRRLREAVRKQWDALPDNWTIVFNPRRSALEAPFEDLCREVGRIFARCKQS